MSLSATGGASGVSRTEYSHDNGTTWLAYSAPATFTREARQTVQYRVYRLPDAWQWLRAAEHEFRDVADAESSAESLDLLHRGRGRRCGGQPGRIQRAGDRAGALTGAVMAIAHAVPCSVAAHRGLLPTSVMCSRGG